MRHILGIFLAVVFLTISVHAQQAILQPQPKHIELGDATVLLTGNGILNIHADSDASKKAAAYLKHLIKQGVGVDATREGVTSENAALIRFSESIPLANVFNDQFYSIKYDAPSNIVTIESPSGLGLLFGAVTLAELMQVDGEILSAPVMNIQDYPDFSRRMFVANPIAADVPSLLDFALQNKMETVVIASRQHPWDYISEEYRGILEQIKTWKDKFGGPRIMQSHNIYDGDDIVIADTAEVNALKHVIDVSYQHGIEKLMILSDDTPPFEFGEGYILTDERDKEKFEHFEAANTWLMNYLHDWAGEMGYDIEMYYVPAFYTYEEMHHGDMELFKDTPWEEQAFGPFYRDLAYLGEHMNENIELIWTGPYVRSRTITEEDIADWTGNLGERVPFLWDNTIYSHHPFTSTPLLTAYDNDLPENFAEITSGNGMFINGDMNHEATIAAAVTTNDYLWNPQSYDPENSLRAAVARLYSPELVDEVLAFKDVELGLRKRVGERALWFEQKDVWQAVRSVRFVHQKNPFPYHLNYTRMKALRLQLKASVPKAKAKDEFIAECMELNQERTEILQKIQAVDKSVFDRLMLLVQPLPNFNEVE